VRAKECVAAPHFPAASWHVRTKPAARVLALSGGANYKDGDDVVGTVGVSGSPGNDDDCSQAGIDKVAAQLK
jgi:uncharacterized protein GlcG (DUF336 family)